jgi:glutaredoxin-like protein NrdH
MTITIYSTDNCQQCRATKRTLESKGINYIEHNVTHDEQAAEVAKGYGYQQAPVVIVDFNVEGMEGDHWSGFRPDKLAELAASVG